MLRTSSCLVLVSLLVLMACDSGRHSSKGFRLPPTGQVERGKSVFLSLHCNNCHQVRGADLPKPTDQTMVVVLGGETLREMTDGYLAGSIINPSFQIASHKAEVRTPDGKSRMPQFEDLTVRQLTDLVAFLQTHYSVRSPAVEYPQY